LKKNLKKFFQTKQYIKVLIKYYINPIEPAVNPTAKKKENSSRSLGRELTISLN